MVRDNGYVRELREGDSTGPRERECVILIEALIVPNSQRQAVRDAEYGITGRERIERQGYEWREGPLNIVSGEGKGNNSHRYEKAECLERAEYFNSLNNFARRYQRLYAFDSSAEVYQTWME